MAAYNRFASAQTLPELEASYEALLESAREEHSYGGLEYEYNTRLNFIEFDYDERKAQLTK